MEKQNAEFSLKFTFTLKKPILATSNSRFVSWLVQFLSEFLLLNQYFVYFWIVKCRKYATRQSGKTLAATDCVGTLAFGFWKSRVVYRNGKLELHFGIYCLVFQLQLTNAKTHG